MQKYQTITNLDITKINRHEVMSGQTYGALIITPEVVLTHERAEHIFTEHRLDFGVIMANLKKTLDIPDIICQDTKSIGTLYYIRRLQKNHNLNVVVKLNIDEDQKHPKNSIITSWLMSDKHLKQLAKKHQMIYNKDSEK